MNELVFVEGAHTGQTGIASAGRRGGRTPRSGRQIGEIQEFGVFDTMDERNVALGPTPWSDSVNTVAKLT